jgi:hypothetical protein
MLIYFCGNLVTGSSSQYTKLRLGGEPRVQHVAENIYIYMIQVMSSDH